ncbi:MAG: MATE family efflux transporter [Bacteroidales bacterium]|nr:MATE family efflux transporter [Bacteroidales bacterium]
MHDFTQGRIARPLTVFAIPIILGNLFMQTYNIVNAAVVGTYLGKEALSAVGAAYPIVFMLMSLIIGTASGGTVLVSQYVGAKDGQNVRRSVDTVYVFIFFAALFITVVGIWLTPTIYRVTNLPDEIMPQAVDYLRVYLLGTVFTFGFNTISAILRGMGDSRTPLYFLIGSNVLNLLLSLLFICVLRWDVVSSAWASVISQAAACFSAYGYLKVRKSPAIPEFRHLHWNTPIFKAMLKIGLPTGFQQSFVAIGQVALSAIVNGFGTVMVAAYSAAMRIDALATMPSLNFGQALSTFVGQNYGARKFDRVNKAFRQTMLITIVIALAMGLAFVLFGKPIMGFFTNEQAVIDEGYKFLLVCGPTYFLFAMMFTFTGLFRGAGYTLVPMIVSLVSLWVIRIPLAYWFSEEIGSIGVWIAIPAGWFVGMALSFVYYKIGRWKEKRVTDEVYKDLEQ